MSGAGLFFEHQAADDFILVGREVEFMIGDDDLDALLAGKLDETVDHGAVTEELKVDDVGAGLP